MSRALSINKPGCERAQLARYLVAGCAAVGTDLLSYALLLHIMWPSFAKAASFVCATTVSYLLNKYWTFKETAHSWSQVTKFATLYGASLCGNVIVNKVVLDSIPMFLPFVARYTFQLAWLMATAFSTIGNYIGQKYWVFRAKVTTDQQNLSEGTRHQLE